MPGENIDPISNGDCVDETEQENSIEAAHAKKGRTNDGEVVEAK